MSDLETLREQLLAAEVRLTALRARKRSWEKRLDELSVGVGAAAKRGHAKHYLDQTIEQIGACERRIKGLNHKIDHLAEGEHMRHPDNVPASSMVPPHPGWTLRCWRALNIGGKAYARNAEVDPEMLSACLNVDHLLHSGAIRWMAPSKPPLEAPKPKLQAAGASVAVDHVAVAGAELRRVAAARGVSLIQAEDLIDRDLWSRAQKQFVDTPQMVRDGAWASGGGSMVQSGAGTTRRVFNVDAFRAALHGEKQKETVA
jgi:hypothetical protein